MNRRDQELLKRGIDIVGATAGLCLLSPVYLSIAASILRKMGAPVLFRHERPGYKNKPFIMLKFRTMQTTRAGEDPYYSDKDRMTPLGTFLRKYSLDELPELFNVLRGEMSLVGPRPLLIEYLDQYSEEQLRRHDVRPGITGWAQVNGRTALTMSKKFELDIFYVDHWNLWFDAKILFMTVCQVLFPKESVIDQDHDVIDDVGFLQNRDYLG